jgi:uncharacterized protein YjbJ (UPF0337 family)
VGIEDKIENKGQEVEGKIKKNVGDATGNQSLEAEGRRDEKAGKVKQAGEKIKDVFSTSGHGTPAGYARCRRA